MTDAEETLVGFVTAQYNKLISELTDDHDEKSKDVIVLINALFEAFKNTDSKHDAIVNQLKAIQKEYVKLDPTEYPRHKNAVAGLNAIVDELKEEEGAGEEEGEE
jgi:hypothetical protein